MKDPISVLPAIALRGTTILPGMIMHFDVSRDRSVKAIEEAMLHDQRIFLITQRDPEVETPGLQELYQIGIVSYIKQVVKLPDNLLRVLVEGTERAELLEFQQEFPCLKCRIAVMEQEEGDSISSAAKEAMFRSIRQLFQQYCMESGKISKELAAQILKIEDLTELINQVSVNLPLAYQGRQRILDAVTLEDQYAVLGAILTTEIDVVHVSKELQKKLQVRIDKNQREYVLREQMKLIREELGEDSLGSNIEEYRQKLEKLEARDEVKEKIGKEISRLKGMNSNMAETAVLTGYIETLLALPWDKRTQDSDDLKAAWKILEEGHYGLRM